MWYVQFKQEKDKEIEKFDYTKSTSFLERCFKLILDLWLGSRFLPFNSVSATFGQIAVLGQFHFAS